MSFTEKDIQQIESKGLTIEQVQAQLQLFKTGLPHINLKEAATTEYGILKIEEDQKQHYINLYDEETR